ncbi:MAG: hypothetical protein HQL20_08085 [Candidatus Omnitrophica bacterium]|nr:hypothetical protein [Candidatus Omnitrophota bacterium]
MSKSFVKVDLWKKVVSGLMAIVFATGSAWTSYGAAWPAAALNASDQPVPLSVPGTMVSLSEPFAPPLLKGVKVYKDNPFRLDFILDKGDSENERVRADLALARRSGDYLKSESTRLVKYFLASITVPEQDLWVNLSPYEQGRIVPDAFGVTEMGRDLLAQDYMLKQITASVIYPEGEIGKAFWAKVYAEAQKRYGTTDIPVDTFNKVWIVPEKAVVYESKDSAYVVEARLKVMLEADYLATSTNPMPTGPGPSPLPTPQPLNVKATQVSTPTPNPTNATNDPNNIARNILREIVIPILEKEVNEGKNFAQLRQVYHSLILAVWYKDKIKESLFGKAYVDQNKIGGVNIEDKAAKDKIWAQYVEAFKKGAYNYIKEDLDPDTQQLVPKKYFSGGVRLGNVRRVVVTAMRSQVSEKVSRSAMIARVNLDSAGTANELAGALSIEEQYNVYLRKSFGVGWEELGEVGQRLIKLMGIEKSVAMAVASGKHAKYMFQYGLADLGFNPEDYLRHWDRLVNIVNSRGVVALFSREFPRALRYINSSDALVNYGERVYKLFTFMDADQTKFFFDDISVRAKISQALVHSPGISNRYDLVLFLLRFDLSIEERRTILTKFLEPYVFSHPEELTVQFIKSLRNFYQDKEIRYFLYFIKINRRSPTEVREYVDAIIRDEKLFLLHDDIKSHIQIGSKEVLVVHNIEDGMGDELIRMAPILQGFLDYNPDIHITIVTRRRFLYDKPGVTVVGIRNGKVEIKKRGVIKEHYDVVVNYYDDAKSNDVFEQMLQKRDVEDGGPFISIKSKKGDFTFEQVSIAGQQYANLYNLDHTRNGNVYETTFRLMAELGLPIRTGKDGRSVNSLIVGRFNKDAKKKWQAMMAMTGNKLVNGRFNSPVLLLNPYGGESMGKGFSGRGDGQGELIDMINEAVRIGFKVIILPNGRRGGTEDVAINLFNALDMGVRSHCTVSPEPADNPRRVKYLVGDANAILAVEGGMMHMSYNMGKSFGVFKRQQETEKWIPYGRSSMQEVVQDVKDAVRFLKEVKSAWDNDRDFSQDLAVNNGGIDLTSDIIGLQVQREGQGVQFNVDPAMIQQLQNSSGLKPVIVDIQPMTTSVSMFLGLYNQAPGSAL